MAPAIALSIFQFQQIAHTSQQLPDFTSSVTVASTDQFAGQFLSLLYATSVDDV